MTINRSQSVRFIVYVMMMTDMVNPKSAHPVIYIGNDNTGNRAEAIIDGTQLYR